MNIYATLQIICQAMGHFPRALAIRAMSQTCFDGLFQGEHWIFISLITIEHFPKCVIVEFQEAVLSKVLLANKFGEDLASRCPPLTETHCTCPH